jgi:hypothetical protein
MSLGTTELDRKVRENETSGYDRSRFRYKSSVALLQFGLSLISTTVPPPKKNFRVTDISVYCLYLSLAQCVNRAGRLGNRGSILR